MSIMLDVEPYCEDCLHFNPVANVAITEDLEFDRRGFTRVTCEDRYKCSLMCEYIKRQMEDDGK